MQEYMVKVSPCNGLNIHQVCGCLFLKDMFGDKDIFCHASNAHKKLLHHTSTETTKDKELIISFPSISRYADHLDLKK